MVLINRERINLLDIIIEDYLKLVYKTASIKTIDVITAFPFENSQKTALVQKLKTLTNAREVRLVITVNPNLIGGFLVKTESKIIDFTVKNKLQELAKCLDTSLDI